MNRRFQHTAGLRIRPLVAALMIMAAAMLPASLIGALGLQIQETYGIGDAALGMLLAIFFGASTLTAAWGGRYADMVGWGRALRVSALLSVLTLVGIATMAPTVPTLIGWLALGGVALSLIAPHLQPRARPRDAPGTPRRADGIKQTSIPLSMLLAGLALPAIALTIGWRWAFVAATLVPVSASLAAGEVVAAPGRRSLRHWRGLSPYRTAPRPTPRSTRSALILLGIGGGLAACVANSISAFAVISAVNSGVAVRWAGILVAVSSAVGLSARVVLGSVVDRSRIGSLALAAGMLALGSAAYVMVSVGRPPMAVIGTIVAFGAGWSWLGLLHHGIVVFHPRDPGAASGVVQVGLSFGSAIGPAAFGFAAEHAGFAVAWLMICALTLCSAATIGAVHRRLAADRAAAR